MLKNILIVNHNIDEANGIRSRLASSTTNAVCAYTIEEAMEAFSKMNFCLVVLDASMSASDDHNLLKVMRESKTMPILLLSSHSITQNVFMLLTREPTHIWANLIVTRNAWRRHTR